MIQYLRNLHARGVLGLNERNVDFIQRFNPRRLYPLVDDKLQTKRLALEAGIAVPELYGVIENQHDVRRFGELVSEHQDFVVKPAHGSGGDGIMVIAGRSARMKVRTTFPTSSAGNTASADTGTAPCSNTVFCPTRSSRRWRTRACRTCGWWSVRAIP